MRAILLGLPLFIEYAVRLVVKVNLYTLELRNQVSGAWKPQLALQA